MVENLISQDFGDQIQESMHATEGWRGRKVKPLSTFECLALNDLSFLGLWYEFNLHSPSQSSKDLIYSMTSEVLVIIFISLGQTG